MTDPVDSAPPATGPLVGPPPVRSEVVFGDGLSGDLWRPAGPSQPGPVLVWLHGGFWSATYDRSLQDRVAEAAARQGIVVWVPEYRRFGADGFSADGMLADVAAGVDALADMPDVTLTKVVVAGHSAGGQLAAWVALSSPVPTARVHPVGVVAEAGVVDLGLAATQNVGGGVVASTFGRTRDRADPARSLPARVPVVCIVASGDTIVPPAISRSFVAAAERHPGAAVRLVTVPGDHFAFLDPTTRAAAATLAAVREITA